MTTLNGWQRLWLLASILWAIVILALAGGTPDRGWTMQSALIVVRLWIVPFALYALGLGFAWVMRGFQVEAK